jgi:hypothetical protein
MPETLAALILAHVAADFLLQPDRMVAQKRRPLWFAAHIAIVLATAIAATGTVHPALLALALAHAVIDAGKLALPRQNATAFALDQVAHGATLIATATFLPGLFGSGLWAGQPALPALFALAAGAIWTIRAGGYAIGLLMAPWTALIRLDGLPNGGRAIGQLERGLIFLMILGGLPEGIGFLIAAKSVLRFGTVREEAKLSEYVIIGTLASFAWAMLAAYATLAALQALPPLGIPDFSP